MKRFEIRKAKQHPVDKIRKFHFKNNYVCVLAEFFKQSNMYNNNK